MKKYILIAGVNGAGKSTLYQILPSLQGMPRVNTDEITKELGSWKVLGDTMQAGRIAVKQISEYLGKGITFNQETTLCGHTIIRNILKAKQLGYVVEMHYIGVDTVDIAKQRVAHRVEMGGHGIPESDIEKRFGMTFRQLKKIMDECDLLAFYDNTSSFRRFAIYKNGVPVRVSSDIPFWFTEYVLK